MIFFFVKLAKSSANFVTTIIITCGNEKAKGGGCVKQKCENGVAWGEGGGGNLRRLKIWCYSFCTAHNRNIDIIDIFEKYFLTLLGILLVLIFWTFQHSFIPTLTLQT